MDWLRKRAGHTLSKMRFMTAQMEAYLADNLWLTLARQANEQGRKLHRLVENAPHMRIAWPGDINLCFAAIDAERLAELEASGLSVSPWQLPAAEDGLLAQNEVLVRLAASFATTDSDMERLGKVLGVDDHESVTGR
jgi:threonine aldolase